MMTGLGVGLQALIGAGYWWNGVRYPGLLGL